MNIPVWLDRTDPSPLPVKKSTHNRADYLEKTLTDIQKVMAEDMYQAGMAARPGFLQKLSPQVKVVGIGLLLMAVALTGSLPALLGIHALLIMVALLSGIGFTAYLARVWLPALFFAGLAVLPGVLSWVTPGQPLWVIYSGASWHFGPVTVPAELAVTRQGLVAAAQVLLRSAASLGLVVLVVKTTRWPVLTKAMGRLGLPSLFVMVLDLAYRYLFLFLLLLSDYLWGRRSRLVGVERASAKLVWIGGALAGFLRMAGEYSREITASMQARGYDGSNHYVLTNRVTLADMVFFTATVVIAAMMLGGAQFVRTIGI
ncbi:MAG: cobalt ECF transporter T component CbiQ [Negativicutes bacterium]|nr:cobalt ECF transporter T component CbiQ [Negativicutes bacterium]